MGLCWSKTCGLSQSSAPLAKQALVLMCHVSHMDQQLSSFRLILKQCHSKPSGSHYHLRSDVTGNRAVWHFDLSCIEIYQVSNVTHHNMTIESTVLQRSRCECQTRRLFWNLSREERRIKKKREREGSGTWLWFRLLILLLILLNRQLFSCQPCV